MSYNYCFIKPDINTFNRILLKIKNCAEDEAYKDFLNNLELNFLKYSIKNNRCYFHFNIPEAPDNGYVTKLKQSLKEDFKELRNIIIELYSMNKVKNINEYLTKNLNEILNEISEDFPMLKNGFDKNRFEYDDNSKQLTLFIFSNYLINLIKKMKLAKYIEEYLSHRLNEQITINFEVSKEAIAEIKEEINKEIKNQNNKEKNIINTNNNILYGKDFNDSIAITLKELYENNNELLNKEVVVKGKIYCYEVNPINTKKNQLILKHNIYIEDGTELINCQIIEKNKINLSEDIHIVVNGKFSYDNYSNEYYINVISIKKIINSRRQDLSIEKRIELHTHSKMSQMDGLVDINEYIELAKYWGHPAVAITDHGNVHIFPDFYKKCIKEGIKPIFGLEGYLCANSQNYKEKSFHFTILVKNKIGLKNLYQLVSESHINYFYKHPRIPKDLLNEKREGLIIGSACSAGELFYAILNKASEEEIEEIGKFYDYFEIMPIENNLHLINDKNYPEIKSPEDIKKINRKIYELGKKLNKLVVATGDVHFINITDSISREAIHIFADYEDFESETMLYFRTTEEMLNEFSYLEEEARKEIVIKNPQKINEMIECIKPIPDGFYPPEIPEAKDEIIKISQKRLKEIYGDTPDKIIIDRYNNELNAIIENNFSSLYYIAHLLVKESNRAGYIVGSRGSVGSSFLAFLLGITEVNPLPPHYLCPECKLTDFSYQYEVGCGIDLPDKKCPECKTEFLKEGFNVVFEVFVGFKRNKIPDIDLNFSGEFQSEIHKWVENYFGSENVYKAGTISTLNERTIYSVIKKYEEKKGGLPKAKKLKLLNECKGVKRTTGQHPGGMIILPKGKSIFEFTPIQYPANKKDSENITTQFDYHKMEGQLLKLDCLGHDNPTQIKLLCEYTGIKFEDIPLDDKLTMTIFSNCKALNVKEEEIGTNIGTFAIPEFNTNFVRQMLNETKPKTMTELIRISGLSHGENVWQDNAKDLILSKKASLKDVISSRDDILIFLRKHKMDDETAFQIMETVRKKDKKLDDKQKEEMKKFKVPDWYINSCDKITYLFPKAHAIAYVLMAFRIAYFKVHFTVAFYASFISIEASNINYKYLMMNYDEVNNTLKALYNKPVYELTQKEEKDITVLEVIREMKARKIVITKIDIYKSLPTKCIIENNAIIPPLVTLEGLGIEQALKIVEARKEGEFKSLEEFKKKTGINKTLFNLMKEYNILPEISETNQFKLF